MKLGNNKKNLFLSFSGFCEGGGNCLKYFKWVGKEKRGGKAKIFKKKGQAGPRDGCFKKRGGLESPYDTMMFTSTLLQDFLFIFINYLFHTDHCYFAIT